MSNSTRPDLNLLLVLEALLAERNVTRAASRLNLSQPALSNKLRRLREIFADPLFVPARRGVIPTDRAIELRGPLRDALDGLRAVTRKRAPFDPSTADLNVAIAASDYAQRALLSRIIAIQREAPGLKVAWRQLYVPDLVRQMEAGEVSLALMTPATAPGTLHVKKLFDESYVVIARRGHPEIRGRIGVEQFCAQSHVVVSPRGGGFSGAADEALARLGRKRRVTFSAATFLIVPELIARSNQIALVPERLIGPRRRELQVLKPPIAVTGFSVGMVWHARAHAEDSQVWLRHRLSVPDERA